MGKMFLPTLMLVFLSVGYGSSTLPGLKLRVTNKGLAYVNTIAEDLLADQLNKLRIPNQSGSNGRLTWWINSIENRGSTAPDSRMRYNAGYNGFSWNLGNFGINLYAPFGARYRKGWFKVSTSGRISLKVQRVSLSVTARFGTQEGGLPYVTMSRCYASVGNVDVKFYGGISFILNLFRGLIGRKIRRVMEGQVCNVVRKVVNVDANRELRKMKLSVNIGPKYVLDYALIDKPNVSGNNVEFLHKGEVFWTGEENQESPLSPRPIPPLNDVSRMLYLWITDYAANSFSQVAFKHKGLVFTITKDLFPPEHHSYLSTTCEMFCIGNFIPEIGMYYPESFIDIGVIFLKAPVLKIRPDVITVYAEASVKFYIKSPDGQTFDLITLNAKTSVSVHGSVVNERLSGAIVDFKLEVESIHSIIEDLNPDDLTAILQATLDIAVVPNVNNILKEGIGLPVTGLVYFKNTELVLLNGSLVIATDVSTQLTFQRTQTPIPKVKGSIISDKSYMSRLNNLSAKRSKSLEQYTTTSEKPAPSSTTQPALSTTKTPELSTTKQPSVSTTNPPELSTTKQPSVSTTNPPKLSTTKQPSLSTTKPPGLSTTKQPSVSTTKPPEYSTTKQPSVNTTNPPKLSTTKQPSVSTTKTLGSSTTKPPNLITTKSPTISTNSLASSSTTSQTPTKTSTTTKTTYPPGHISHFIKQRNCLTEEEVNYLSELEICDPST